jgi:hypothetical protein
MCLSLIWVVGFGVVLTSLSYMRDRQTVPITVP